MSVAKLMQHALQVHGWGQNLALQLGDNIFPGAQMTTHTHAYTLTVPPDTIVGLFSSCFHLHPVFAFSVPVDS